MNIYVLCGNARTFLSCIDSCYENIINSLETEEKYILFYLKLSDPGPKGQELWDFSYPIVRRSNILSKITELKMNHPELNIISKIVSNNEITDEDLYDKIKDRTKYIDFLSDDKKLLRSMHYFYNFEICGNMILKLEQERNEEFSNIIFCRPDLYFTKPANNISSYDLSKVILGHGPNIYINDHLAIIPRNFLNSYFFDRMRLFENNIENIFCISEDIYVYTIEDFFTEEKIGEYHIKRA